MYTQNQLDAMKGVDLRTVDKTALPDASGFQFDTALSKPERAERVLGRLNNPYCFRYGGTAVKVEFAEDGPPLQDVMSGFLARKKSGV